MMGLLYGIVMVLGLAGLGYALRTDKGPIDRSPVGKAEPDG